MTEFNPFENQPPAAKKGPEPVVSQGDNWVSFQFQPAPGFDVPKLTVHGSPEFVAEKFAVDNFNGKVSQLLSRAIEVDAHFKKLWSGEGKA